MRMNPRANANVAGILKMEIARPPSKKASMMPGMKSRRVAAGPTRLKICSGNNEQLLPGVGVILDVLPNLLELKDGWLG